ncbi:replicative DNA helicase [Kitasatospora xanthocidica]|uniref:replicative DNA helicase n=1 Tax=Kitasatospora xanthocidica TaxID=83382 RepID=UPI0036EBB0B5
MTIPPQASPYLPPTDAVAPPGHRRHRGEEEREMERRPPQDLSAEQSVLGSMLLCPNAINDVTGTALRPEHYYRPAHALIHRAILDLHAADQPADPITLAHELTKRGELCRVGGASYLHTLVDSVPTTANVEYYAEIVHERAVLRRLIVAGTRITGMGYAAEGHLGTVLDTAQAEVMAVTCGIEAADDQVKDWAEMIDAMFAAEEAGPVPFLPLPYADLEAGLRIEPGDLVVVGARPAMGKSVMLVDLARHAAIRRRLPVYLNSLEMTHTQVIQRMVAAEARVPLHGIRDRTLNQEQEARRLRAIALAGVPPLTVDTSEEVSIPRLRSRLRRLQSQGRLPAVLLVDYLQLMTPETGRAGSRTTEVDELARGLKILAKAFNIPVIVAAQLNRCVEQRADKKPAMADLRESGGIEANANAIILLHREDAYAKDSPRAGEADLIVAKNRMGGTFTATVAFQGHYSRFVDITRNVT